VTFGVEVDGAAREAFAVQVELNAVVDDAGEFSGLLKDCRETFVREGMV
jgi:hypothetical protein